MVNGSTEAMDQQTVSFIGDGNSITYRRDTLLRNPRYPDIANYTITAPNPSTGFVSLYPTYTAQQYELITQRHFIVQCQISDSSNYNVLSAFQTCNSYIPSIFTYPIALTSGQSYYLSAYLIDEENFLASDKSQSNPASVFFNYVIY
jgi:hypothetical protein